MSFLTLVVRKTLCDLNMLDWNQLIFYMLTSIEQHTLVNKHWWKDKMPRRKYVVHEPTPDDASKSLNSTSNFRDKPFLVRVKVGRILIWLNINIDTGQEDSPYVSTVLLNTIRERERKWNLSDDVLCIHISILLINIRFLWKGKQRYISGYRKIQVSDIRNVNSNQRIFLLLLLLLLSSYVIVFVIQSISIE